MLWAVVPPDNMNSPWLLVVVPLVPLIAGGYCVMKARGHPDQKPFETVKQQLSADMAMLREVSAAHERRPAGTRRVAAPRSAAAEVDGRSSSRTSRRPPSGWRRRGRAFAPRLLKIAHPPPKPSLLGDLGIGSFGSQILERLKALPGAALVLESIEHWWASIRCMPPARSPKKPRAATWGRSPRKNPVAVIVGGVVFGALLVASKPWRWLLRPALFVGLVPQIAAHALKRMPLDSWLQMLSTFSGKRAAHAKPPGSRDAPASGLPKEP